MRTISCINAQEHLSPTVNLKPLCKVQLKDIVKYKYREIIWSSSILLYNSYTWYLIDMHIKNSSEGIRQHIKKALPGEVLEPSLTPEWRWGAQRPDQSPRYSWQSTVTGPLDTIIVHQ